jgi:hypothetical protein
MAKSIIMAIFAAMLSVFATGCSENSVRDMIPTLDIIYMEQRVEARQLGISWYCEISGTGLHADVPHPLQLSEESYAKATIFINSTNSDIIMEFNHNSSPETISAMRWLVEYTRGVQDINETWDKYETVEIDENIIIVENDGQNYIYHVEATWSQGKVGYVFRVISE